MKVFYESIIPVLTAYIFIFYSSKSPAYYIKAFFAGDNVKRLYLAIPSVFYMLMLVILGRLLIPYYSNFSLMILPISMALFLATVAYMVYFTCYNALSNMIISRFFIRVFELLLFVFGIIILMVMVHNKLSVDYMNLEFERLNILLFIVFWLEFLIMVPADMLESGILGVSIVDLVSGKYKLMAILVYSTFRLIFLSYIFLMLVPLRENIYVMQGIFLIFAVLTIILSGYIKSSRRGSIYVLLINFVLYLILNFREDILLCLK
ncbi:MAG: hypothetical protein JXA66_03280 [Oligoflexia bacterium]|nr:hypothetical protein [Oligoflexia bacterium]